MPSLYAHMMNLVFRCMPQDKPGQPHVFTGKYKVLAAKKIYRFLEETAS